MKSICRIFGLAIGLVVVIFAQTAKSQVLSTCSLTKDEAPALLSLKLGMTPSEVSAVLGRSITPRFVPSKIRITKIGKNGTEVQNELTTKDSIGESEYSYYPRDESNIGSIFLRFWNDQLYTIALDYEPRDFLWSTQKIDSRVVAEKFGFPLDHWEGRRLTCQEFYIDASRTSDGVSVDITDSVIKDKIQSIAEKTITNEAKQLGLAPIIRKPPEQPPVLKNKIDLPVLKTKIKPK